MIAAEDDRNRPRLNHLGERGLDRLVGAGRIGRQHRRIAEIDHFESFQCVDSDLKVRSRRTAG